MIKVLIGDMFASQTTTLVNTVNCVGVMGKGVAEIFKQRFPIMFKDYAQRCKQGLVIQGVPYIYKDILGASIINFPTKKHWRSPSLLDDVINGLDIFVEKYKEWGVTSVAFPPLGCGNGGLSWTIVGPIMFQKLSVLSDIKIEIYAPYGTPHHQLSIEFLKGNITNNPEIKGQQQNKIKPEWLAVLDVVYQLEKLPNKTSIGRTIFQKICYIITEQGIETEFNFVHGSYGPFSSEVKDAIQVFANANLIKEQQFGKMTALKTTPQYEITREKFFEQLAPLQKKIAKTVDLFSRIKSTSQAEEITTVLYAVRNLKKTKDNVSVTEQDLFDYILNWKKSWREENKQMAIISVIRYLEKLGWMRLEYSESLAKHSYELH